MDYKEMTYEDIDVVQKEINKLRKIRGIFIGVGWGSILTFLILLGVAIAMVFINEDLIAPLLSIASFTFLGGLVILIISGAAFNKRIKIRAKLIRQAKQYIEMNRLAKKKE